MAISGWERETKDEKRMGNDNGLGDEHNTPSWTRAGGNKGEDDDWDKETIMET